MFKVTFNLLPSIFTEYFQINSAVQASTGLPHGFKHVFKRLVDLCVYCDVVLIQEHWLAPFDLHKLDKVCDNMVFQYGG